MKTLLTILLTLLASTLSFASSSQINSQTCIHAELLAHNPDINKKNSEGNAALMIASEHGQTFVVEQLIANGADTNAKNMKGFTSLEIAKRNGHASVIDLLRNTAPVALSK